MNTKFYLAIILIFILAASGSAQKPGGPPRGDGQKKPDWTRGIDTNHNGTVEPDEFQSAIDRTFTEIDRNANGVIERNEAPHEPRGDRMGPPEGGRPEAGPEGGRPGMGPGRQGPPMGPGGTQGMAPGRQGPPMGPGRMGPGERPGDGDEEHKLLPPFFFMEKFDEAGSLSKADFERTAKDVFAQMDANHDGALSHEESRPPKGSAGPPPPPNAMFIAAELRFGDRLVKDQPFSADSVIEDTKRLYDGTTVTKKTQGAIYRDTAGRTRREQPLEMVGGFDIVGDKNKPQTLVFINDFATNTQYFLDLNNKVARRNRIGQGGPPRDEPNAPAEAKTESLGTKTIEGVSAEGTRITFEIPAGHIGNDKPIQVVTENWFSPELQLMVMSRHLDPLSGEHVFRLINIKRAEPAADLFTVPSGFRVENAPDRQ